MTASVSVIVVSGNSGRNKQGKQGTEVSCLQLIPSNFMGATVEAIDGLLATIKVQSMKGRSTITSEMMVRNNKTGEAEYISMDDTERLKEMVSTEVISTMKEHYEGLVDTIGEFEANRQILTGIVGNVMSQHSEWETSDTNKKLSLIAEFIMEVKEHDGTDWLPDDYTDSDISKVIREVEHIAKHGYAPNFDQDDVSYG